MIRLRHFVAFISILCVSWITKGIYTYIYDTTPATITVTGLENPFIAGDKTCTVQCSKKCDVCILIDNKETGFHKRLSKSKSHTFTIPSTTLNDGPHALRIVATDTSYNKNQTTIDKTFTVDNLPLRIALLSTKNELQVLQGRTLRLRFSANKEIDNGIISAIGMNVSCCRETPDGLTYEAFLPVPVEQKPSDYILTLTVQDYIGNQSKLSEQFVIKTAEFKKQQLAVENEVLKAAHELGPDEKIFEQKISQIVQQSPTQKLWQGPFCTPIDIEKVTCEFGTIRTTQHRGRYAHKALDIINKPKSVVWSTQDGVVVLKQAFAVSGNTVVIDHGMGILSLFYHLDSFANIEIGDKIAKGNPIGTIGKTGYAKGYHLHWEMRVHNIAVDPMQWTELTL